MYIDCFVIIVHFNYVVLDLCLIDVSNNDLSIDSLI